MASSKNQAGKRASGRQTEQPGISSGSGVGSEDFISNVVKRYVSDIQSSSEQKTEHQQS